MARQTQWAATAGCWLVNWRQERPFGHEKTTEFQKSSSRYVWCFRIWHLMERCTTWRYYKLWRVDVRNAGSEQRGDPAALGKWR